MSKKTSPHCLWKSQESDQYKRYESPDIKNVGVTSHQNDNRRMIDDKVAFLRLLGLVTQETGQALREKLQVRKKRSCASPNFVSLLLQAEKEDDIDEEQDRDEHSLICIPKNTTDVSKHDGDEIMEAINDDNTPDETFSDVEMEDENQGELDELHDDGCRLCKSSEANNLLLCDTCPYAFHLHCLGLSSVPKGIWFCPSCESQWKAEKSKPETESSNSVNEDTASIENCLKEKRCLVTAACTLRATLFETRRRVEEKKMLVKLKNEREEMCRKKITSYLLLLNNINDLFAG